MRVTKIESEPKFRVIGNDVWGEVQLAADYDGSGYGVAGYTAWVVEGNEPQHQLETPVATVEDALTWMQDIVEFTPDVRVVEVEDEPEEW